MKRFLLAGVAALSLCAGAQAASITYTAYDGTGAFYAPTTTHSTNFTSGVTGSTGSMTSPFSDSTTPYDVVNASGSATFSGASTGSGSFGTGSGTFSFLWGTPDDYNTLTFLSGTNIVASFTGAMVGPGNGSGSYIATISGLSSYDHIEFTSSSDAFEFAAVSAVPLPTALPMFGGAILVLGALGVGMRRKSTGARA